MELSVNQDTRVLQHVFETRAITKVLFTWSKCKDCCAIVPVFIAFRVVSAALIAGSLVDL